MKINIDDVGNGAVPVYDASIGDTGYIACPDCVMSVKCVEPRIKVQLYPITAELLRHMAKTIEAGENDNKWNGVLVVNSKEETAGLLVH